jgi:DNA-binding beta-propeller fold protein YncE
MTQRSLLMGVCAAAVASCAVPMLMVPGAGQAQGPRYEVWAIDQADVGQGGARLYIYDGQRLEANQTPTPEIIDLTSAAVGVGDGFGIRPHLLEWTSNQSHAVISNVATGHVYIMRARDRKIVGSIDVGEQAHHAAPTADGSLILAANQNGKRLARIRADFAAERFTYNRADDLNLGAMEDAAHPDNAPICPVVLRNKAYVTVRGGGIYVVDYRATPMRVLREYGRDRIAPAGCGALTLGERVYVNSGTATSSDIYVLDATSDQILKHLRLAWTGSDLHGMIPIAGGRFLWVANRADSNMVVVNTNRDAVVGVFGGFGAAPDLMALSPSGRRVFLTLRGPNNLTGGPTAKGETPGVAILEVTDEGRGGRRVGFLPIGNQTPASPNDVHTVNVRVVR